MINLKEKVSQEKKKLRLDYGRVELDKRYKVTSSGMLKPAQLPIFIHKFVFFDVTSCIDIVCARSFLCQPS